MRAKVRALEGLTALVISQIKPACRICSKRFNCAIITSRKLGLRWSAATSNFVAR